MHWLQYIEFGLQFWQWGIEHPTDTIVPYAVIVCFELLFIQILLALQAMQFLIRHIF